MAHEVRIPVPRADELRADVAGLLPLIAPAGREPARTMAVLARQPDLLSPFLGWAAALALNGVLSHRDHELLALRVASNCGSEFEWVEHVEYALDGGLDRRRDRARSPEPIDDGRGPTPSARCCAPPTSCTSTATSPTRRGPCSPRTTTRRRWSRSCSSSVSTRCCRWSRTRPGIDRREHRDGRRGGRRHRIRVPHARACAASRRVRGRTRSSGAIPTRRAERAPPLRDRRTRARTSPTRSRSPESTRSRSRHRRITHATARARSRRGRQARAVREAVRA